MPKPPDSTVRRIDAYYRVSLPEEVRRELKLEPDDFIHFKVQDGQAVIRKARIVVD